MNASKTYRCPSLTSLKAAGHLPQCTSYKNFCCATLVMPRSRKSTSARGSSFSEVSTETDSASACKRSISRSAGPARSSPEHWRPPRPRSHHLPRVMPAPPILAALWSGGILSVEEDAHPRSARPPKTSTRRRRRTKEDPGAASDAASSLFEWRSRGPQG